jgi:hypothetical protein
MPFSNTPFDLKTVIVRALDSACTNAATRIKRLFKSILWRYQGTSAIFCSNVLTLARWNPFGQATA